MNFKKSSCTAPSAMLKFFENYAESPRFPLVCYVSPRATSFLLIFFFLYGPGKTSDRKRETKSFPSVT